MPLLPSPATLRRTAAGLALTAIAVIAGCTATPVESEAEPTASASATPSVPSPSSSATPEPSATRNPSPTPSPTPDTDAGSDWSTPPVSWGGGGSGGSGTEGDGSGSRDSGARSEANDPEEAVEEADATARKDIVKVVTSPDIGEIEFDLNPDQVSVTPKQPFTLVSADYRNNLLTFSLEAGRKNSPGPAEKFNTWTDGNSTYTMSSGDKTPSELHYAFCGDLSFDDFAPSDADDSAAAATSTCLGQGRAGARNNWWMGGADYGTGEHCYVDASVSNSNGTGLVACTSGADLIADEFTLSLGSAHNNYLEFVTPQVDATVNPHAAAEELYDLVKDHLSPAERNVARLAIHALPTSVDVFPGSWEFVCEQDCAGTDNYRVTEGQLWAGVHSTENYTTKLSDLIAKHVDVETTSLNATAGRHKSSEVADWFVSQAGDGAMAGVGTTGTAHPNELNFSFCGELEPHGGLAAIIGGPSAPLCVAQGSAGAANNWWVGGPHWHKVTMPAAQFLADIEDVAQLPWILVVIKDALLATELLGSTDVNLLIDWERATVVATLTLDGAGVVLGGPFDNTTFVAGIL